jgi:integrase
LLLLHTGLRRGEATALRWSHVFLEAPKPYLEIDVTYSAEARRAAQRGQRQYPIDGLVAPKTRHSRRRVWLSPEAADTLRELARLRRERAFRARRELSPFVFVGPRSGTRVDPAITNKVFATAIAAIGLAHWRPAFTVHDLRHTFATVHLGRWRSPLAWVSAMLGHKKQSTTLDIYSKWLPEDDPVDHAAAMPRVPAGEAKVAPGAGVAAIDAIVTPNRGVLTPRRRQSRR